jgi:hypothetical protein
MLASSIAIKGLPMLHLEDKVSFALQCMEDFDVQHLAVIKEDYFIGLVSKSDLLDTDESNHLESISDQILKIGINGSAHFLMALDLFTKHDYEMGTHAYSWDSKRWNNLLKEGWIVVWRKRNHTTQKYHIYKVSFKCRQLIARMYRILLGEEDIPSSERRNKIMRSSTYSSKTLQTAIRNVNNDKTR